VVTSVNDRATLRSLLLLVGLSRRWRGLETVAWRVHHSFEAEVKEALRGKLSRLHTRIQNKWCWEIDLNEEDPDGGPRLHA